jgi:hypothetical protein
MLPRRAHTHPGNRPKATSVRLPNPIFHADLLIHRLTDPTRTNHQYGLITTRLRTEP